MMNEDCPYIIVSYTTDKEGQDIQDEDMVQPINHRWCYQGGNETTTWKLKSWAICPTYGSCQHCLKSGPVGKSCNECQIREGQPGYVILRNQDKFLDSITIAEMFNQGHDTAKADQYFTLNMERIETFNSDHLCIATQQIYQNIQDPVVKANLISQMNRKFYAMLE
jgi:hypothetical protein